MTKRKSRQSNRAKQTQTRFYMVVFGVAIVILAGFFVIFNATQQPTVESGAVVADSVASQIITPREYMNQFDGTEHVLLDVRTPQEYDTGHISGSINIAVETLAGRLDEVPRDQPIVVYCRSGNRSAQAAQILTQAGFTNVYDLGGIIAWEAAGLPVQ